MVREIIIRSCDKVGQTESGFEVREVDEEVNVGLFDVFVMGESDTDFGIDSID